VEKERNQTSAYTYFYGDTLLTGFK